MTDKTIITCAVTGSSLSPSMSPHLPLSPAEIIEQGVAAVKAGASILHLHARAEDGRPTNDVAVWREIINGLRSETDAILNMSASLGPNAQSRIEPVLELRPELATVITGSINYGLFRKVEDQGAPELKLDWEKQRYGSSSYDIVMQNSFATIDEMISTLDAHEIGIEFECYDVGHLLSLDYYFKNREIRHPLVVQFLTGILGGIRSDVRHLTHLADTARLMFGDDVHLFTHGTGTTNIRTATAGALIGTHLRVGQEDNLIKSPGVPFSSNAEQVEKMVRILNELNMEAATVSEARDILGLPA